MESPFARCEGWVTMSLRGKDLLAKARAAVVKELKTQNPELEDPLQPLSTWITFASLCGCLSRVAQVFGQPCKTQRSATLRTRLQKTVGQALKPKA